MFQLAIFTSGVVGAIGAGVVHLKPEWFDSDIMLVVFLGVAAFLALLPWLIPWIRGRRMFRHNERQALEIRVSAHMHKYRKVGLKFDKNGNFFLCQDKAPGFYKQATLEYQPSPKFTARKAHFADT